MQINEMPGLRRLPGARFRDPDVSRHGDDDVPLLVARVDVAMGLDDLLKRS